MFSHAGALLLYTSLISFAVFRARGNYSDGAPRRIVRATLEGSINSTIGILTMVAMFGSPTIEAEEFRIHSPLRVKFGS